MTRREAGFVMVAALAGFLGGTVANGIAPVHAQEHNWPKTLTAERLVIVNPNGARRVEISVDNQGQGNMQIYDEHGRLAWSAPDMHLWPAGGPRP